MRFPPADEMLELEVTAPGEISFPPAVTRRLGLAPGAVLALVSRPLSLQVERLDDLLADVRDLPAAEAWPAVAAFLRHPLTTLTWAGTLFVPPEAAQFETGERALVQVLWRGPSPEIYLSREPWDAAA